MQDDNNNAEVKNHLAPIIMNHRRFVDGDRMIYRVYTSPTEFQRFEAESAHEAYTKSGLSRAYKIQRDLYTGYHALKREQLEPTEKTIETDPTLPDTDELRSLLVAVFGDDAIPARPDFEEMTFGDLEKKLAAAQELQTTEIPANVSVSESYPEEFAQASQTQVEYIMPAVAPAVPAAAIVAAATVEAGVAASAELHVDVMVEAAPQVAPAPEKPMGDELTAEEVEALLNAT